MKSPIRYPGGKQRFANWIVSLLPAHHTYCEPFCGGASVLFAKPPAPREVIADNDPRVVALWRTVRDQLDELLPLAALLEPGEKLFRKLQRELYGTDELYRADELRCALAILFCTSFGQCARAFGSWGYSLTRFMAGYWQRRLLRLKDAAARLQNVVIHCADWQETVAAEDSTETVFYLDPPYEPSSLRTRKWYSHVMDTTDHMRLVDTVITLRGKVLLSSYPSSVYNHLADAGWTCLTREVVCRSIVHARCTPQMRGQGADWRHARRTEMLWLSPRTVEALRDEGKGALLAH